MKCNHIRERMLDVASGSSELTAEESNHFASCNACAEQLKAMRSTMTLLDEWQVPEPSPYFDVRLQARLREEMGKPQGWLHWFRRPVLAAALTVAMGAGIGVFFMQSGTPKHSTDAGNTSVPAELGTAVSDLQTLDKNNDLYANFELLDDMDLQQDVQANP